MTSKELLIIFKNSLQYYAAIAEMLKFAHTKPDFSPYKRLIKCFSILIEIAKICYVTFSLFTVVPV